MKEKGLIDRYIETDRAGEAWLRDTGVDVWALVMYYQRAADRNVATVARDYDIPLEAVEAALAYYDQHREVIDATITSNLTFVA